VARRAGTSPGDDPRRSRRRAQGRVFENGCGLGAYLVRLAEDAQQAVGLDIDTNASCKPARRISSGVRRRRTPAFPSQYFDWSSVTKCWSTSRTTACPRPRSCARSPRVAGWCCSCPTAATPSRPRHLLAREISLRQQTLVNYLRAACAIACPARGNLHPPRPGAPVSPVCGTLRRTPDHLRA
jgi:hypothetical protein